MAAATHPIFFSLEYVIKSIQRHAESSLPPLSALFVRFGNPITTQGQQLYREISPSSTLPHSVQYFVQWQWREGEDFMGTLVVSMCLVFQLQSFAGFLFISRTQRTHAHVQFQLCVEWCRASSYDILFYCVPRRSRTEFTAAAATHSQFGKSQHQQLHQYSASVLDLSRMVNIIIPILPFFHSLKTINGILWSVIFKSK